ncbi:MAG: hypothetical protein ABEK50_17595 [bacterium]
MDSPDTSSRNRWSSGIIGFTIEEAMSGSHRFVDQGKPSGSQSMRFTLEWGPRNLLTWLNPMSDNFLRHPVEGSVTVEGLCEEASAEGFMELRYFTERTIRYVFTFSSDGEDYRFYGEKNNLKLTNLHRTHTTLKGDITRLETGETVSDAELYFYWSTLPSMIYSFRLK